MIFLEKVQKILNENSIAFFGSALNEIETAQFELRILFPTAYFEFLELFGKSTELFCGEVTETRNLKFIQESGRKVYYNIYNQECSDEILFIMEHQFYSFYYIYLNESQNPDVYLLINGDEITNKKIGKLGDVITSKIDNYCKKMNET